MEATKRNDEEANEKARAEVAKLIEKSIEAIEPEFVAVEADDDRMKEIKHLARSICAKAKEFLKDIYVDEECEVYLHIFHYDDADECDTYSAKFSSDEIETDCLRWVEIDFEDLGNADYVRGVAAFVVDQYEGIVEPMYPEEDEHEEEENEEPRMYEGYYYLSDDES